jgi:hypothetical protein
VILDTQATFCSSQAREDHLGGPASPEMALSGHPVLNAQYLNIVGRSDTNEGRTLKESHTYEKRPTKMQQASHKQATNKILSHFYQLI